MKIRVKRSRLIGCIGAISSKSDVHRALICAAFSDKDCFISSNVFSKDMEATMSCLNLLGAKISYDNEKKGFSVCPIKLGAVSEGSQADTDKTEAVNITKPELCCKESGSTLRFLLPVVSALGTAARFTGLGRLPERPMSPIVSELRRHGMYISSEKLPMDIKGKLSSGDFTLRADISSQFISGLILSFPLMSESSALSLSTKLESAAYVDMTIATMRRFGAKIEKTGDGYLYRAEEGRRGYISPGIYEADGDWSNAAFFLAVSRLTGEDLRVEGLRDDSVQGDKHIIDILKFIDKDPSYVMDASEVPDLVPICAVYMALSNGDFSIVNAGRLRIKESDRLSAAAKGLRALGASVEELPDGLKIKGMGRLKGGATLSSSNDHRMAMAFFTAGLCCEEPIVIDGAEAVSKSYPDFYKDMESLGAKVEVLEP